ncbi:multiple sugar transport system permease protein [Saccharothrix ecbatanensis]|uniref:Multiple sugar transport system permease protein n=1 Tax=Saccharothrix ecbatanensis TaxID=1105145 RepID=A0A7W9HIV3_9PSEU|nr:carbohydrate ABC transporter permease [Saccharothrix ecbatanensis]MBB5803118.1 multiple sugar transport system permease protein [Saccharothrix ecbatanensis]
MTATDLTTRTASVRPDVTPGRRPPWASKVVVNAVLVLATAYTVLPLTWLLVSATKGLGDLYGNPFTLTEFRLFDNVANLAAADNGVYLRWYVNSLLYAVGGAGIGAFISVMAGYVFDKFTFPGKEKLFGFVLLGVLVPSTALALPLYLLASELGVVNTFWSVFVPVLVNPFGVYLARIFSAGYVPAEVLEAARVDGASELTTFWAISLRMLMPGFVTIFLFQFTGIWNNFFLPLVMLSDQDLYPLSLGLYAWHAVVTTQPEYYPLTITGALLAVVPVLVAFLSLQRHWRAGMTSGAVK